MVRQPERTATADAVEPLAGSTGALQAENAALRAENAALKRQLSGVPDRDQPSETHQRAAWRSANPGDDAEFLRSLLDALPVFVARYDSELRLTFINQLVPGLSLEQAMGRSMFDFVQPEYHDLARRNVREAHASGRPQRYRVVGHGPNGRQADYETIVAPVRDPDGGQGTIFLAIDVTEASERERALEQSQQRLRVAVEATGIGLWSWDAKTNHAEWSPRTCEIMGRNQPLAGDHYLEAVHPDDVDRVRASIQAVNGGDERAWTGHRIVTPNGDVRSIIPCGKIALDDQGRTRRIVGGMLDVTTVRSLETRLRQAEKMQSLGTLTAGVAHNVNNMLAVILPILDELRPHLASEGHELLRDALAATHGAAGVVRQLMSFAGQRKKSSTAPVAVADSVRSAVEICRRSLADISIDVQLGPRGPSVACDEGELKQVVVNLLANARDALASVPGDGKRIVVRVDRVDDAPASLRGRGSGAEFARIVVEDNGPGIERDERRRIFDPFFTTKGPLAGAGLGLATAWAVVSGAGGTIECRSTPGRGAVFSVYLPVVEEVEKQPSKQPMPPSERRVLKVLLVEDNEPVRRIIARVLRRARHAVVEATTAAEALDVEGGTDVDVVLLDQSLPDARGIGIVDDLRKRNVDAKILLFTGEDVADDDLARVDGLISKPVTGSVLLSAIARQV